MRALAAIILLALAVPAFAQNVNIDKAWYSGGTDIYGHRIMGSIPEYLELNVQLSDGTIQQVNLAGAGTPTHVFEDMAPRLADMTGDGINELIVVESDLRAGAALVIYGLRGGTVQKLAETPHIGTPFRWLAPVGIGDFDGDGAMDVAYVDRPHLARLLRVWRFDGGNLTEIARARGLTNHRIGEETITGGVRRCGGQDQMVVVTGDWSRIVAAYYVDGQLTLMDAGKFGGPASVTKVLQRC